MEFRYSPRQYTPTAGVALDYHGCPKIKVTLGHNDVILWANKDGLVTLAMHMLALAQPDVPFGCHNHYDRGVVLEDDSENLIITQLEEDDDGAGKPRDEG